jgi:hypothetical protein
MIQTGIDSKVKVHQIVENQLPEFILDENPKAVDFLKQYYISQEYQGGPSDLSENLDQYLKVDNLTPEVVVGFTSLTTSITSSSSTIEVDSTKGFPKSYGLFKIDDEIITYTGITTNSFTGCIRGFSGITSYRGVNNPEDLVFSSSTSASHSSGSPIQNLSSLFLKEFYRKLKFAIAPGLENVDFVSNLNAGNFLKEARTFYQSKGTEESFEILYKVLYGVTPSVIDLERFLLKPSDSQYIRREIILVEKISGSNVNNLVGQTVYSSLDENTSAAISEVEIVTRQNKTYYKIGLFIGYSDSDLIEGNFSITANTRVIGNVSAGSSVVTVDSTIGFPESGTVICGNNTITYSEKTINQFLGCSGISESIQTKSELRSNDTIYGYENGDLTKKVELKVCAIVSDLEVLEDSGLALENEKITVKHLGDLIKNPSNINDKTYKQIFSNSWIYNTSCTFEVESFSTSTKVYTLKSEIDESSLKEDDRVDVINNVTDLVVVSDALVSSVDPSNRQVTLNYTGYSTSTSIPHSLRRVLKKTSSENVSIKYGNDSLSSDVQNVYSDDSGKYMYVASNSLPSFRFRRDATPSIPDIVTGIGVTFIGAGTIESGALQKESADDNQSIISFPTAVPFLTGDAVVYSPESTSITGLNTGTTYYVKVLTDPQKIKLYSSRSFIPTNEYLKFDALPVGVGGKHVFTIESNYNKEIESQKLLKRFPLRNEIKDNDGSENTAETVGMLINGVEIKNYKSTDKIYYGPLENIKILNSGTDYDVINPPQISITASGTGVTAYARPVVRGFLQEVLVDPQTVGLEKVISVSISGGNGSGAVLKPITENTFREIDFDSRLLSNFGGIGEIAETITFLENHNLVNGQAIVYKSNGNTPLGIGTFQGSNADQNRYLIDNSKYYVRVLNNKTVRLYQSFGEYVAGINTVGFTTVTSSGIHKFRTADPINTLKYIKVLESGSGYENRHLYVKPVGISTIEHLITFKNHNFNEGDIVEYATTGTEISGLSTSNRYYVIKENNDAFRLANAGVGATVKTNYTRGLFAKFDSVGSGYHIFKYPDVQISVNVSYGSTNTGIITATPIVRGEIIDAYLYESGTGYGSTVINFEKKPLISIKNGKDASLYPVVIAGKITRVDVRSKGSEYYSIPTLRVIGDGVGAILRPVIENGQIIDVVVISAGTNYTQENTSIGVVAAGRNAKFDSSVRTLTVNDAERFDSEYLRPAFDKGLEYCNISYSYDIASNLFSDDGSSHSPIIGWSYDGNPIYGPYGYSDPLDTSTARRIIESGYVLDSTRVVDRPSGFTPGFFVEDYAFDSSGDLDIHNGRFCKTPDFPKGTYAYFAGISTDGLYTPKFPYFIGDRFKSHYEKLDIDQEFDFNNSNLVRNTFPYKIGDEYSNNEFIIESNSNLNQEAYITSVTKGEIDNINVTNPGDLYNVNDTISFNNVGTNGGGLSAIVSSIKGETITSIASSSIEYSGSIITWNDRNTINIHIDPYHVLDNLDIVSISGLSTFIPKVSGLKRVSISTDRFTVFKDIPANASSGIVTDIYVSSIPNSMSIGSTIGIGTEILSVLNVFSDRKVVRVKRGVTGSSHTTTSFGFIYPNVISLSIESDYFDSNLNDKYYFNPTQAIGIGTTSGVGVAVTYTVGERSYQIDVPTQSIYLPDHQFRTSERVIIRKNGGGNSISVSETPDPSTFNLLDSGLETVYVINKGKDYIGIVTQVGFTTSTSGLFFHTNGSDNFEYSIEPTKNQITCTVQKNTAVVSVSTAHNLSVGDQIKLSVISDQSVGIGTSSSVYVKFNSEIEKLIIDPVGFGSDRVNISENTINLPSHRFRSGDKVYYTSTDLIASGLSTGVYYISKLDKDNIKLCPTYNDVFSSPPVFVSIASTGGAGQEISAINPKLQPTKGNDLVFDVSDSSLNGYDFKIYSDKNFNNEFVSIANTTTFSTSGVGTVGVTSTATFTLHYSNQLPGTLFYNVEKSGFISTADFTVQNYSQITYIDSLYNGTYSLVGVGTTSAIITLLRQPESDSYDSTNSSTLEYSTTSTSPSGEIEDILVISKGVNYKTLPGVTSVITNNGIDALLFPESSNIGKTRSIRLIDQAYEYSSDKTLRPETNIPPTIKLKDSLTIDSIDVTFGGRNYTVEPDIVIVDTSTGLVEKTGQLSPILNSNSISSVEILQKPTGLTFNTKKLYTVNNSNGTGISTMQTSASGIVTCFLTTPLIGFSTSVFSAGEKIFVEGITKNGDNGTGFNSEDYGYQFFTVESYENLIPAVLRFNVSGLTTNPGIADTIQGSFATIVKESNYPTFKISTSKTEFLVGERLYVNDLPSDLYVSSVLIDYIKVTGNDQLIIGDIIRGLQSGSVGTVSELTTSRGKFKIDFSVKSTQGWKTNVGQLNSDIQVLPDNDYYQNLSYSVKSPIQYKDSIDTINRLLHTTGLKNFVDTTLQSNQKATVGVSTVEQLALFDLSTDQRVDTIFGFALVKDIDSQTINTNQLTTKFLKSLNKKFVDSLVCKTNRVLLMDDVSSQFTNKENIEDPFVDLDEYTKDVARFLVQVRSSTGTQVAIYELIIMWSDLYEDVVTLQKGYLSNTGIAVTYTGAETAEETTIWTENTFATLEGNVDNFDVLSLRFTPDDIFDTDYDIKFIKDVFIANAVGLASTSIGLVKAQSSNNSVGVGTTSTLFEYNANEYDSVHATVHLLNENKDEMNFVELYLSHDGTNTYVADYYFDNSPSEGISLNDFGDFDASLDGGVFSLTYSNPTASTVRVKTNAIGFGATSSGIGTLRFINDFQPDGTERSAKFESTYTVGAGETTIYSASSTEVCSIKSLISVSYGGEFALHQLLTLNANETNTFSYQYPFLSVGSETGIGTFGSSIESGKVYVKFYPDTSVSGIVTIKSYNEVIYTDLDLDNTYPNIDYGFIKSQSTGIGLFDAVNSPRINKTDFELKYEGNPIFKKEFNPANTATLDLVTGVFSIKDHFFSTGEELIYRAGSTITGISSSSVGIGETADSVGIVTNVLPSKVWAYKINNDTFKISTRPEYAAAGIGVTFTSIGSGNAHSFEMVKCREKTIISVDEIIQAPLAFTPIVYQLENNIGGFIGTGSTIFSISGISSILVGDILKIEDEYMKVAGVGFGTTTVGPISGGTLPLINVIRGFVGTAATLHIEPNDARIYRGSYNVSGSRVHFTEPPKGSGLVALNDSGLPRPFSKFNGRVFLRNNYENNLIYDDISLNFTGVGQTFTLTTSGVNTTGIETGSGLVLINGIFQTPTTDNNAGNNFFYTESAGISSITFTGITSTDGTKVTSIADVNQNEFPRGGLIVSLGSTNGLGFAPLVGASVTAVLGATGDIVSVGLGSTDILGSGYNGLTGIGVSIYEPGHTGDVAVISAVVGAGGSLTFSVDYGGSGYTNPDILVDDPTYENLEIVGVSRLGIGTTTTTGSNALISLKLGPNSNSISSGKNADAAALINSNKTLISDVAYGRMQAAFPSFVIPTGDPQDCKDDIISVLDCIIYNLRFGGNDSVYDAGHIYIDNAYLSGEEAESVYAFEEARDLAIQVMRNEAITVGGYSDLEQVFDYTVIGDASGVAGSYSPGDCADVASSITSFVGIVTNAVGLGTIPGVTRTIAPGSLFEVSEFKITRQGYGFEIGDVFKPVGLVTAKGLAAPVNDFELTVVDVYYDKFSSWQFGQLDFIDPIAPLQNGTRSVFPLRYNSELVSFEKDETDIDSSVIDLDAVLIVFLNGIIQEPRKSYIFDGGSSIQFIEAPKPEDNISIFFYNGTRGVDSVQLDISETIKSGDSVFVNKYAGIATSKSQISKRIVVDIPTADKLETNLYYNIGIDEYNYRTLDWIKQKRDLSVNGDFVYKSRDSLEAMVFPTARIIRDVNLSDTEIFVDNAQFFNYEENESSVVIPGVDGIFLDEINPVAAAGTATVSAAGTVTAITLTNSGIGYTTGSIDIKFSAPKYVGVGVGTTASATATIVNGSVSTVTITNPGFGYTNSNNQPVAPQIIFEQPKIISEIVTDIAIVQGNTGIITGITTTAGIGTALALKFFTNNTTDLQVGYQIYVTGTNVGSGVTSIYTHDNDIIGIGTEFVDNIYYVHAIPIANEIVCNIKSDTITTGIQTLGTSVYNPNGYYSWGRLSSMARGDNPIAIGISGRTVNVGLTTYPTIQRRGYGLRDNGSIRKVLPD